MKIFITSLITISALTFVHSPCEGWTLGMNIHASDGNNLGWGSDLWDSGAGFGDSGTALQSDYVGADAWNMAARYIAIARHQDGQCEAVSVWPLVENDKSMKEYFDLSITDRIIGTDGGYIYQYISPVMAEANNDPIFGEDGDLAFNWWYGNNGTRIALEEGYARAGHGPGLPGETRNNDDFHGLGNELAANPSASNGGESLSYWHDVAPLQGNCHGNSCAIWGSDNGNSLSDCTMHGQFAIYVSAAVSAPNFDCENATLALEISESATDFVETQGIRYVPFKSQYVLLVLIALLGIWFVRRQR